MSDTLYRYYERELTFIRRMAEEFARGYPAAAGRLMLESGRSADPHVERLIESFALLAGRVHHKLDDEFPELTDGLLGVLYPHYLAPIPSMAIVQFELDSGRAGIPKGFTIPKGSRLRTQAVGDIPCKYRTGDAVTLWPVRVLEARLAPPPFPEGMTPPPRAVAALRLRLNCAAGLKFADLGLDALRLYLAGDRAMVGKLYELVFNHAVGVVFRPLGRGARGGPPPEPISLAPADVLGPVGFDREQGLLPYPAQSFEGYRLLSEFFAFPAKFSFVDLGGFRAAAEAGFGDELEVVIFLNRSAPDIEGRVDASTFRLGCTPAINLFEQVAEPIRLTQSRYQYRVIPDVASPDGMEVYSVDDVTSTDPATRTTTHYKPFYSAAHGTARDGPRAFWHTSRLPSVREGDRGTDVEINLVDLDFNPRLPAESTVVAWTTCTNRELPVRLQHLGDRVDFQLEAAAPISRVRCVVSPTPPLRPPSRRGAYWRLVSHLNLNHLSLSDGEQGLDSLREILRLYDFSDQDVGDPASAVNRQIIEGIASMSCRRVVGRIGDPISGGFCRGTEIALGFDERNYVGTGIYPFACVLDRFFALYTSINSFTQLVASTTQAEGPFRRFPPRTGAHPLI
ncbi:type VI secretion system baseplate subunit TssF [Tundrisphaera sp. TA3]|uniref:type VI secretion system baseplate subunit TssF n=1 Tax=Tundrisphaera sp. TA3 TaxID=3435775 RepID=UPI003EB718A0